MLQIEKTDALATATNEHCLSYFYLSGLQDINDCQAIHTSLKFVYLQRLSIIALAY